MNGFLTAWNEWGEGAYLEPDTINKFTYLEAIKAVVENIELMEEITQQQLRRTRKKLSIVIVAYNNRTELLDCLDSIYTFNDLKNQVEVIIVDNSPNDSVKQMILDYPHIYYIKNPNNGFGCGNNLGYQVSLGEYLFFLNPDTLLTQECFIKLINKYESSSNIGIIGTRLVDDLGNENNSYNIRMKYGLLKKIFLKISNFTGIFIPKYMYTSGANIFINRKIFEKVGGFDENIFMYGEEEDLAYRLDRINKRMLYFPAITIVHLQGKSTGYDDFKNRKQMLISCKYICKKYGFNFQREMKKEVLAMKIVNIIRKFIGKKPKYSKKVIVYYESLAA